MVTNNFFSLFSGNAKDREMQETRASWDAGERSGGHSPLAALDVEELAKEIVSDALEDAERVPATPVIAALCEATEILLRAEALAGRTAVEGHRKPHGSGCRVPEMLTRRSR